jgi:glycine cleavage system H protein
MSKIPAELLYRETHEWVRYDDDGTATVGISDHAQEQLGDMVFIELPEPGMNYEQGDACAVVESVKAASDIYAPLSGKVTESNSALEDAPELVNTDPYGDGWLFRMRLANTAELDDLLDAAGYAEQAES